MTKNTAEISFYCLPKAEVILYKDAFWIVAALYITMFYTTNKNIPSTFIFFIDPDKARRRPLTHGFLIALDGEESKPFGADSFNKLKKPPWRTSEFY